MRRGTPALEKGAGVVKHARHMFVSKGNTLPRGISASTVPGNALRVDFVENRKTLGRRFKRACGHIHT